MPPDDLPDAAALVHDLVEVAGVLASRADAATKLTHLCASAVRTIGCDRSSVFLAEHGVYRARCNHGNPPDIAALFPEHRVRFDDPLVAHAVERRSFVIVNDAATDPLMDARVAAAARIQAIVVVPLFAGDGEPAGFMTAEYNERPGVFTPLSSTLLLGIAKLGETVLHAEREAAEQAELRRQLEVASRLDAINRLAAGVAHDLSNQLTAVLGAASLLVAQRPDPDVGMLLEAAETAQRLGRRLLGVGREQPPPPPPAIDLSAAVLAAAARFRQFAPRHALRFDVEPGLHVACSATDLEQTLTNLVLNASDAAPPGTEIVVSLAARPAADDSAGPMASLSVRDRGTGIEPELLDRIFEPFFTTKGTGSGTGLGLSSVSSIAAALGGTVAVDSAPGAGTTVTVRLPLVAAAGRPDAPPQPAGGGATVLVVDDTRVVLDATVAMLSLAGYAVRAAGSGEEALADPSVLADVTALVTDWTMPGMSGLELARHVRARRPDLPVVLVSGIPVDPALCELPGTGPMTFLVKPFGPKELLAALAER